MRLECRLDAKVRKIRQCDERQKNPPGRMGLGPGLIRGRTVFRVPLVDEAVSVDSLGLADSLVLSALTAREG